MLVGKVPITNNERRVVEIGARGCIGFIGNDKGNPGCNVTFVYTHWRGPDLPELVQRAVAVAQPRWGDPSYATRMALTHLIGGIADDTGWGVDTMPGENEYNAIVIDWDAREAIVIGADMADLWWSDSVEERAKTIATGSRVPFAELGERLREVWKD